MSKANTRQYSLPDECTIYEVSEIREALLPFVEGDQNVEVDLSKVTMIDASIVQLLLSLNKELTVKKLTFSIGAISECAKSFIASIHCKELLHQVREENDNG